MHEDHHTSTVEGAAADAYALGQDEYDGPTYRDLANDAARDEDEPVRPRRRRPRWRQQTSGWQDADL